MSKPVVRREGTVLLIENVTKQQFAELCSALRSHFGGRLHHTQRPDGSYEICFAKTIEKKRANFTARTSLRQPVKITINEQHEFMKQAKATALLILEQREKPV
jgi:hypothetical protein